MIETLKKIVAQTVGLSLDCVWVSHRTPLAFQSNRLYDAWAGDRHLIIKEYLKSDEFHDAPVREFRALELLAPLDIAPQPVLYRPSAPPLGPIVVYEYLEGQMWDRYRPTAKELAQLAAVLQEMNGVSERCLWRSRGQDRSFDEIEASIRARLQAYSAWVEAEFPAGQIAVELVNERLTSFYAAARELVQYKAPLCFSQSDTRFANVIGRPDGRLGLVDWEDSGLRDPARDLAGMITHPNQEDLLTQRDWEAFLHPYVTVRSESDPGLLRRMHLYLGAYPVFWISLLVQDGVRRACSGQLAGWGANRLPPNERLRRYVARALAWPDLGFAGHLDAVADVAFFPDV